MQSTIQKIGNELHIMPGAGCLARLAFLIGVCVSVLAFAPVNQRGGAEWYKVLPVGLGLLVASTYRRHVIIDQDAGHISRNTKVAGYTAQANTRTLARFSHVALGHQWKNTDNNRHRVFYVSLSGDESFSIAEHSSIDLCRNLAEQLAASLSLPIHDSSTGGVAVIAPKDIGLSLKRKLQKEDRSAEPAKTDNLACEIRTESNTLHISVPQPGFSLHFLATLVPTMAFGAFIIWIVKNGFEPQREIGDRVTAGIGMLVAGLFIFVPLAIYISRATRKVSIALNRSELRFESKTILWSRSWNIDAEQVINIFGFDLKKLGYRKTEAIGMAGGVAIRSKQKTIRFGDHLSQDEQKYLCQLLRYWISQP